MDLCSYDMHNLTLDQAREIRQKLKEAKGTPDASRRILWKAWYNMLDRCYNSNCSGYRSYGAKGITVEDRWRTFENFLADMRPTWRQGWQLDRANTKLGYSKDNCQWLPIVLHAQKTARDKKREELL